MSARRAIAFACNLMRVGLRDPRCIPQEVLLPQFLDETPVERRIRAEIMGDNIQVGRPWPGTRFDASLLKRPMVTADAMIESLMRHCKDFDAMFQQTFEEQPNEYHESCSDLSIRIEALASPEIMSTLQLSNPYQLLGLYHGISLAKKGIFDVQMLPNELLVRRNTRLLWAQKDPFTFWMISPGRIGG